MAHPLRTDANRNKPAMGRIIDINGTLLASTDRQMTGVASYVELG
jgi:hypothetical protein